MKKFISIVSLSALTLSYNAYAMHHNKNMEMPDKRSNIQKDCNDMAVRDARGDKTKERELFTGCVEKMQKNYNGNYNTDNLDKDKMQKQYDDKKMKYKNHQNKMNENLDNKNNNYQNNR